MIKLWNQFILFRIWINDESVSQEELKVLSQTRKARDRLGALIINGRIILICILKKNDGRSWIELFCFKI
jgi:hypothetical protein